MKKVYLLLTSFGIFSISSNAQVFFSNGATIIFNTGATVISNGGVELTNSTSFTNNGDFTITKNSTLPNPGNFEINTSANAGGDGDYHVEQDWINDATFNAGTSSVELNGNTQQFITSTTGVVTTFNDLLLTGSGAGANRKKTLQSVDANIGTNGTLSINDRELETQTQTMFVLNNSVGAVTNSTVPGSEGFVSSLAPGTLSRVTNTAAAYLFPTGSSAGTLRYRPIEIVPNASAANTYTVRMNNVDATVDGFDRNDNDSVMCLLNDKFYHSILRPVGTTASDIRMFYINASDGPWEGMAHWRTTTTRWNDMSTMTYGTSGVFNTVTRNAWNFTNPGDPYILSNIRPEQPSIVCANICENSTGNIFTLSGTSTNYLWTVPSGGTITSGQGTDTIQVDWTTGAGYVYVYAVGAVCNSLPDSCLPVVLPVPVADFTATPEGSSSFNDTYAFTNNSTNASVWTWEFGDGSTSTTQNPTYQYNGAGDYTVILTVSNAAGCTDTDTLVVTAGEGMVIPNVFTPNGDGLNDNYIIQSGGLTEYNLSIFNRWGQAVFESTEPNQNWDGNFNGSPCTDGTYYFILKAKSLNKDYSTTGNITLIRKK